MLKIHGVVARTFYSVDLVFPVGGEMQLRALCWFGQGPKRHSMVVRSRVILICLGLSL